ncbi:MAG: hypothetical protein HYV52_00765 [Parcubacteria group bacterium]|nr:hypothetical protein [Parcubacteria group bacterium]
MPFKRIIPIASLVVLAVFVFGVGFFGLLSFSGLNREVLAKIFIVEDRGKKIEKLEKDYSRINNELILNLITPKDQISGFIAFFEKIAENEKLEVNSQLDEKVYDGPSNGETRETQFLILRLILHGRPEDMKNFLVKLEKLPKLINIQKVAYNFLEDGRERLELEIAVYISL